MFRKEQSTKKRHSAICNTCDEKKRRRKNVIADKNLYGRMKTRAIRPQKDMDKVENTVNISFF